MAKAQGNGTMKVALLAVVIVAALGLAIWKGSGVLSGANPDEATFTPRVKPPADNEFRKVNPGAAPSEDKTGAEG